MENKVIKVAQVIGMAINGGTESLWMNYYRNIDRTKIQFDFLVESESEIINREEIEALGGHVVIIPSYKTPFKYMKALTKIFKENKYDIVHSNMSTLSVFTLKAAKKAGIKVRIAHSHSTSNKKEWKKNIMKNMLRPFSKKYSTDYFSCSELAGRYLFGDKTYDQGKVTIINNAIEIEKFKLNEEFRKTIRDEYQIADTTVVLGNVGRMGSQKNQIYLLDIFKVYNALNNDSKLLILGDGPLHDELVTKAKTLGIESNVIFAGVHPDIYRYYSAMDVFCMPSLYEGLPVVGIETQANGLPVLFADTITKEVGINDNSKFESLSNDANVWANDLVELVKQGRTNEFKSDIYDIKKQAKDLKELYNKILK